MASVIKQTTSSPKRVLGELRSYNEVVEFLDGLKKHEYSETSFKRMQTLDKLCDSASTKVDTILVGGANGKSSTINFAAKLLAKEGFKVGAVYSSHFLNYTERVSIDGAPIPTKQFADTVNEVINTATVNKIKPTSFELVMLASLLHFQKEKVDVVLLEVGIGGLYDATNICRPKICALTRVAQDHNDILTDDLDKVMYEMIGIAKKNSWFISAEQSKIRLQKMKLLVDERGAQWAMPIRKLAALPYIFEQLYGRSASLAERIAQIYVEDVKQKFSPFLRGNLLATQRGQRGRPTLEAKRQAELNPIKTLKAFWSDEFSLLRGRFELLDKEKPTILLDNAHNLDALTNLFLGIRLLHYQRPLKGLSIIMGIAKFHNVDEIMKLVRYLFKKVSGEVYFVPLATPHHTPEELVVIAKELNVKAKACRSFTEAFETVKKTVDEREGLVAITGCPSLITEYWKLKGLKKFA